MKVKEMRQCVSSGIVCSRDIPNFLGNSKMYAKCSCCWADQGAESLPKVWQRGLWSVRMKNCLPSNMSQKWWMAE